jgi:alpha-galactosidase
VRDDGDLEVWAKELADGDRAVILLNRSAGPATIEVKWPEIGYPAKLKAGVRDLWQKKDLGPFTGSFSAAVPSHGVVMVIVKP